MASITGTQEAESIVGTDDADAIRAGDGNDTVAAGGGDDLVYGEQGADYLQGGAGSDTLFGGSGNDYIVDLDTGDDVIFAEDGVDVVFVNRDHGPASQIRIEGGSGGDQLAYSTFDRKIDNVTINAGSGDDVVQVTGAATSIVDLGDGNDRLETNTEGKVTVTLGEGHDTVSPRPFYQRPSGEITVRDFETGEGGDRLDLSHFLNNVLERWDVNINPFGTNQLRLVQVGSDVLLQFNASGVGGDFTTAIRFEQVRIFEFVAANLDGYPMDGSGVVGFTRYGTEADDSMIGRTGNDLLEGGGGRDVMFGQEGDDTLRGGDGDDQLIGGPGNDIFEGGAGDDSMIDSYSDWAPMEKAFSRYNGGDGVDTVSYGHFVLLDIDGDTDRGDAVGDTFVSIERFLLSRADDVVIGGAGDDYVSGYWGNDWFSGNAGNDSLFGDEGNDTLEGGQGNDLLQGGAWDDTASYEHAKAAVKVALGISTPQDTLGDGIDTLLGIERVIGSQFGDTLTTEWSGVIDGGGGADFIKGGDGYDNFQGGAGEDTLWGGDGADTLEGGADFDQINGNQGNDTARGGEGGDWVVGGKDQDLLYGDAGDDIVYGNLGNDTCYGGDGADWVRGGQGDDVIDGGAGNDWMAGDRGNDTVTGGAGADKFYFFAGAAIDRVTDFSSVAGDRVLLDAGQAYTVKFTTEGTIIDLGNGDQMILVGVTQASLGDWLVI